MCPWQRKSEKYAITLRLYEINLQYKTVQLDYTWYGQAFRGTGLDKHCKYLPLESAFETLRIDQVEFRADNNNKQSIAVMKSIGCKAKGILRSHMPKLKRDVRRDCFRALGQYFLFGNLLIYDTLIQIPLSLLPFVCIY